MNKKKYYKCVFELNKKIPNTDFLCKVNEKGYVRGFFNSKKEVIDYAKTSPFFKKVITVFSNEDVNELANQIKKEILKTDTFQKVSTSFIRYKADALGDNKRCIGLDMMTISLSKYKFWDVKKAKQYHKIIEKIKQLPIIKKHDLRYAIFAKENIPYAYITFNGGN